MKPGNRSKYPGKPPVNKKILLKYSHGDGVDLNPKTTRIKNKYHRQRIRNKEQVINHVAEDTARTEMLLTEDYGFLEADTGETTTQFKQSQLASNVDITSASKHFKLNLEFGPYCMRYTRNGRHLLIGGKRGHIAAFDWITKKLSCELNAMESVHDAVWLHVETMFAVAQKNWVHIYDNQGIEIHCLKRMHEINRLEFLPYHFLLASGSKSGFLSWLDVSIGQMISSYNSRLGRIAVMTQNPSNAILCVGGGKGVVSMWSPNSKQPLAKMLCHTQAVSSIAIHPYGLYMATSSPDRSLKIWDIRQLSGPLQSAKLRHPATQLSYSQRGLLGVGMGNIIEVYRDTTTDIKTYMRHKENWNVSGMQFCPFEDVLGVATDKGFTSVLIPGSAEANFDALEINPFQTKSQRKEAEVKALLDKIQPDLITLDSGVINEVDVPTLKDEHEEKKKLLFIKPKKIDFTPRKTKAKGKGGTAKVIKSRKILKQLAKQDAIKAMREAEVLIDVKKPTLKQKNYGVLNRFLPKS